MKTLSQLGAAALAATLYFAGTSAPADEVVIQKRVVPTAPVVVTPAPAPAIEERRTTTTTSTAEPRRLTDAEKEKLEKEREYREKVREAKKDLKEEIRDADDD